MSYQFLRKTFVHPMLGMELPPDVWDDFGFGEMTPDNPNAHREFIEFDGDVYPMDDFTVTPPSLVMHGWHGYLTDSVWSGIVIRYSDVMDDEFLIAKFIVSSN